MNPGARHDGAVGWVMKRDAERNHLKRDFKGQRKDLEQGIGTQHVEDSACVSAEAPAPLQRGDFQQ